MLTEYLCTVCTVGLVLASPVRVSPVLPNCASNGGLRHEVVVTLGKAGGQTFGVVGPITTPTGLSPRNSNGENFENKDRNLEDLCGVQTWSGVAGYGDRGALGGSIATSESSLRALNAAPLLSVASRLQNIGLVCLSVCVSVLR